MKTERYVFYEENGLWIGWLEQYPDYRTQGETLEELQENLLDIFQDLTTGAIPNVHHFGELVVG